MKRFYLPVIAALTMALGLFTSCTEKEDTSGEPKMYAFGFLAAKNGGNLFKDYYVDVTDSIINIKVPYKTDITFLVASFEMSDKDSAYVGGTFQKTGKSGHDFTNPVYYSVRDGSNYAYYKVVVTKAAPLAWAQKATLDLDAKQIRAVIDTTTGFPAAVAVGHDGNLYYITYSGGSTMNAEKIAVGGTALNGSDVSLCFSEANVPYVAYIDSEGGLDVVCKTTGWQYAGQKVRKGCRKAGTAVGFALPNLLAVFASDSVSLREGNAWTGSSPIGGNSFSMKGDYPILTRNGSVTDVLLRAYNPDGISICSYNGSSWKEMATDFGQQAAGGQGEMQVGGFDACLDYAGDILMAVSSNDGTGLRQRVLRYDYQTGAISQMGSAVTEGDAGVSVCAVESSYANDLYFLYTKRDAAGNLYPYVAEYEGADADWGAGLSMNSQPIKAADIVVNSAGNAFVLTVDATGGKIVMNALE